ncbi:hypothetical protein AMTRI_Chr05g63700 [Amborella trichopoda]
MRTLTLRNCTVGLPKVYKGFSYLTTLILQGVYIQDKQLTNLISKCGVLQNLTLRYCRDLEVIKIKESNMLRNLTVDNCLVSFGSVDIDAPNLLSHDLIGGVFYYGPVLNVPRLLNCSITQDTEVMDTVSKKKNYGRVLHHLVNVETLSLQIL